MAKKTALDLDRDQQILNRLSRIENKVDSLEQTTAFALRAEADKHFASAKAIFKNSKRRAQIYLAADGMRGVQEIAAHLKMKRQNVGPDLRVLRGEGLLELTDATDGRDIWTKKPIDHTLRISHFLRAEYSLGSDGLPVKAKAKAKSARKRR